MKYIIGMDGGGTKTKCLLADKDLNIFHECVGGPSAFLMLGTEAVSETLLQLVDQCKKAASIDDSEIECIVLGTTGAGRRSDAERMENSFLEYAKSIGNNFPKFSVQSDGRVALEGAFSGKPGSILIAGTGSFMLGKNSDEETFRVGGYGRFIGDEGSGYMLGKKGFIAVAKEYDKRGPETALTKFIAREYNINDSASLITAVYKDQFDIASIAPLVIKAAKEGDEICRNILEAESEELIQHIAAMKTKIKDQPFRLSLVGGMITTENYYADIFKSKLKTALPDVQLQDPDYPPAMGAVIMAKQLAKS